jgi:hypothetical protein
MTHFRPGLSPNSKLYLGMNDLMSATRKRLRVPSGSCYVAVCVICPLILRVVYIAFAVTHLGLSLSLCNVSVPCYSYTMNPPTLRLLECSLLLTLLLSPATAVHHMKLPPVHWVSRRNSDVPLKVTNNCNEDIYPGIGTQAGIGPDSTGFLLRPGTSKSQAVSADWNGRVWARTNCSFNALGTGPRTSGNQSAGPACTTGDCGGKVACGSTVS